MPAILVLFAHPALEKSRVHQRLLREVRGLPGITIHDLYEAYPDFDIDVPHEQALLRAHEVIVFQHPLYWYSTPPLLKQWFDLVLQHGWAYGRSGTALRGKRFLVAASTGGGEQAYQHEGFNRHTIAEFLAPVEQTGRHCGMEWLPPHIIHGSHRLDAPAIADAALAYRRLLESLRDGTVLPVLEGAP